MTASSSAPDGAAPRAGEPRAGGLRARAIGAARIGAAMGLGLVVHFGAATGPTNRAEAEPAAARPAEIPLFEAALAPPAPLVQRRTAALPAPPRPEPAAFRPRFPRASHLAAARRHAPPPIDLLETRLRRAAARDAEILAFGPMRVERRLVETIRQASLRTGADLAFMMALADKESSLRTEAAARTSSAEGLFQFIEQTWLESIAAFGARHGLAREAALVVRDEATGRRRIEDPAQAARVLSLRRDPMTAALMAGETLRRDRARIEAELGRPLAAHEAYIAHFLGPDGAARFLALKDSEPKTAAAGAFAAAARANRSIFYAPGRRGAALAVAEVDALFAGQIGSRLARYAALGPARPEAPEPAAVAALARPAPAAAYSALHEADEPDGDPLPTPLPPPRP